MDKWRDKKPDELSMLELLTLLEDKAKELNAEHLEFTAYNYYGTEFHIAARKIR